MVSNINSTGIFGISGYMVTVECFLSQGLPSFDIVGLPNTTVRESRRECGQLFEIADLTFQKVESQ